MDAEHPWQGARKTERQISLCPATASVARPKHTQARLHGLLAAVGHVSRHHRFEPYALRQGDTDVALNTHAAGCAGTVAILAL